MKRSLLKTKSDSKDFDILAGRYVWDNYSLYGKPVKILFSRDPTKDKLSTFEIQRPILPAQDTNSSHYAAQIVNLSNNTIDPSCISVSPASARFLTNQGTLHGSLVMHKGRYMLTDGGESIREMKKKHRIDDSTLSRLLGNMRSEREIRVYADELCVVLPDIKNLDKYKHEFAIIVERFRLICDMTLS